MPRVVLVNDESLGRLSCGAAVAKFIIWTAELLEVYGVAGRNLLGHVEGKVVALRQSRSMRIRCNVVDQVKLTIIGVIHIVRRVPDAEAMHRDARWLVCGLPLC